MTELTLGFLMARARAMHVFLGLWPAPILSAEQTARTIGTVLDLHERLRAAWNDSAERFYQETGTGQERTLAGFLDLFATWRLLAGEVERLGRRMIARPGQPPAPLEALRAAIGVTEEVESSARGLIAPAKPARSEEWETDRPAQEQFIPSPCPQPRGIQASLPELEGPGAAPARVCGAATRSAVVGRRLSRFP
jgi:hypothetical protein